VVSALSQWKFNPEPVGFIGEYEIVFNLQDWPRADPRGCLNRRTRQ
jgi:hypothetical protein